MQGNVRASYDRLTGSSPGGVDFVRDRIRRYTVEHPRFLSLDPHARSLHGYDRV